MALHARSRRPHNAWACALTVATFAILSCRIAEAQAVSSDSRIELTVRVEHIAGADLYLSAGTEDGIRPGDSLAVSTGRVVLGRLFVVQTSSKRAVASFVDEPFSLTRGQTLHIKVMSSNSGERDAAAVTGNSVAIVDDTTGISGSASGDDALVADGVEQRTSVLNMSGRRVSTRRRSRRPPQLHGRIYADMSSMRSSTPLTSGASGENGTVERGYMSPSSGLRLSATDLPGGIRVNVNARGTYQHTTGSTVQQIRSLRVYQASVSGTVGKRIQYETGRFTSRYEVTSGYWDGLVARLGGRQAGFGLSAGFEPERYNQSFSTAIPKFAGFANLDVRLQSVRYGADVSVVARRPTGELQPHSYITTSHDLRIFRFRFSGDLQLDHDPESGSWVATRVQVRTSIPIHRFLSAFGRFSVRQPYAYWRPTNMISYRRDQWSTGFSVNVDGVSMGGTFTDNRIDGRSAGRGYGMNLRLNESAGVPVGFSASANLWTYESSTTRHLSTGVDKSWGGVRSALTYTYYDSELLDGLIRSHVVGFSVTVPIVDRVFASAQVRTQVGGYASRTSVYSRIWMSF